MLQKIVGVVINILFYLVVFFILLYFIFGFRYFNMRYNLASPKVSKDSLVVAKAMKTKVNDMILVRVNGKQAMIYQVKSIGKDIVNGNNSQGDVSIKKVDIIGTVVLVIPFIGTFFGFLITKTGLWLLLSLVVIYVIIKKYFMKK